MNTTRNLILWGGFAFGVAMAVIALLAVPSWSVKLLIAIGVLVFLAIMLLYPAFWARRQVIAVVAGWITISAASGFKLETNIGKDFVARIVAPEPNWSFHFACVAMIASFLAFELVRESGFRLQFSETRLKLRAQHWILVVVLVVVVYAVVVYGAQLANAPLSFCLLLLALFFRGIAVYEVASSRDGRVGESHGLLDPVGGSHGLLHHDIFHALKDGWQMQTADHMRQLAQGSQGDFSSLAVEILRDHYVLVVSSGSVSEKKGIAGK